MRLSADKASPRWRSPAGIAGGAVAAVVVAGAGALLAEWLRERATSGPGYETLREDGLFSLRRYPSIVVATADANGSMKDALDHGVRRLYDYISGKRRAAANGGDKLAMTVPVLAVPSPDHPGRWAIRFAMPKDRNLASLPAPGHGVRLEELPERLVAAVRFNGRITDRTLANEQYDQLLAWVRAQSLTQVGDPEFAAYNSPLIPGAMRRNEWWVSVREPG